MIAERILEETKEDPAAEDGQTVDSQMNATREDLTSANGAATTIAERILAETKGDTEITIEEETDRETAEEAPLGVTQTVNAGTPRSDAVIQEDAPHHHTTLTLDEDKGG